MANVETPAAGQVDASSEYQQHRTELMGKTQESYVNEWLKNNGGPVDIGLIPAPGSEDSKKLDPFPINRPPPPRQSTAGKVMRNVGEIGPQAVHGLEEAVYNAFGPLNAAVEWLDANVADLRYTNVKTDNQPETLTGKLTRGLSQFFVGFLPAGHALRTAGLAAKMGSTGTSMAAGAMADFAVRSGNEERLSNWWQDAGLPKNILTDALAAEEDDSPALGRFKGAVEGVLTGAALEGVIKTVGAMRAARKVAKAQQSETDFLREKYGEVTDAQRMAAIGDSSRPLIEPVNKPAPISGTVENAVTLMQARQISTAESVRGKSVDQINSMIADAVKKNDALELDFVSKNFSAAEAEAFAAMKPKQKEAWIEKNLSPEQQDALISKQVPESDLRQFAEFVDQFDTSSAENMGKSIAVWFRKADDPHFSSSPEYAGIASAIRYAKEQGWSLDDVLTGARARAAQWAGTDAEELFTRMFRGQSPVPPKPITLKQLTGPNEVVVESGGPTPEAVIGGRGVVKAGDQELYVNFARIDKPDDVKNAIATMAQAYKGKIDEATRGKISQAETARMAEDLGMTVEQLTARRRGQPLNAEEALAARQLWAASADNLVKLAKAASGPNAGNLDQFAFRRAMATHAAIQSEVIGARTETARALASWRIPAGSGIEQAKAIQQALEAAGGSAESATMAAKLSLLAQQGDKAGLAKFVEKGWGARSFDALRELWINGLLSSPATHIVNVVSNSAVAMQAVLERGVAAKIGQLRGTEGGVEMSEALAMAYGNLRSMKDAFVMSARALKTGETGMGIGKIDLPRERSISTEALQMASDTALGRTVDFLGATVNIPGRLLMAEDELFKTVAYRGELSALAARQATAEGKTGADFWRRIKEIEADAPAELKISAQDAAAVRTFTDAPGKIGKAFMQLRESAPAWTFIMPFVRTPVNIARYTFERSPLAPLVGQWRADIAAGGARADLALAKMSVGTTIMASALDWADSGLISGRGPKNIGERESMQRQGWQQYSVKVGDRWYSYNRLDPYGALLGFAADAAEAIRSGEMNEDDVDEWSEVLAMGIGATAQVAVNKTYLKGVSDFFAMMHDGTRYGPKYVENLLSSFIPFTALSGAIERANDPVLRETSGPWDAINAKLAGMSDKLPPRLTLWGDEVRLESGLGKAYDFFSPVRGSDVKANPVDMEINRLSPLAAADNVEGGFQRIGKRTSFMGIEVNFKDYPEAYTEYVRLAGNALRAPEYGLGAKDLLNETVQGRGPLGETYKRLPDIDRIKLISTVITKYRKLAQMELLQDPRYADFARHFEQTRELMLLRHQAAPAGVVQ